MPETPSAVHSQSGSPKVWVLVFLAVGVALVVISVLLGSQGRTTLEAVSLNLGLVAIAVVVVDQLWQLTGGNPIDKEIDALSRQVRLLTQSVDVIERSKSIGLETAYDRQGDFGNQAAWEGLIEGAVSNVDLMGRTLFGWTRSKRIAELIITKIQRDNVNFRWLIMSQDNKYLPMLTEEDINIGILLRDKLVAVEKFLREIHERLPEGLRDRFQVRAFSHVPLYCAVVKFDDRCYVTNYLFSRGADDCPLCCFRGMGSAWPKAYMEEFELIWKSSRELFHSRA